MWEAGSAWEVVGTQEHLTPDTWERLDGKVGGKGRKRPSQMYIKDSSAQETSTQGPEKGDQ